MNDREVNLLEQYDVEVLKTRKGRGAILCETSRGCLIFKEYSGNDERLATQNRLLTHLQETADIRVESILPDREGNLCVKDRNGVRYILKTYAEGRECNINDRAECLDSVRLLARLHSYMELDGAEIWPGEAESGSDSPREEIAGKYLFSPAAEYDKRNRELKRVRRYLKQRSQKTWFEIRLQQSFDFFLDRAFTLAAEWAEYEKTRDRDESPERKITFCHGDYQYHNLIRTAEGWFVVNFEKCVADDPVRDLYLLMRKLLEKSNWSVALGREILAAYEEKAPLSALSRIDLYYRLAYPEKFWKIVNFYYNSGKAWIPGRNLEKLEKVVEQEKDKQYFLDTLFGTLNGDPG
ncbi:MAG: phosphotransferase [Acetatifactor muris]|nr:phosphotransferase [Acetatifactor muris]MCM1527994.1 phosphotransferase [Bacteroides sp.]